MSAIAARPSFAELFTPKLITVLREGYGWGDLQADIFAGLTVAIVALPLSMAIAIACGVTPERGLYTSIIGGFIVSVLSGSRFQIGGPAGAFIVLIYGIVEKAGYDGLVMATMMSGVILAAVGLLRWGGYIKYISLPVIVGFTAGIAIIIFSSQIKDLLGLTVDKEPAALLPKLQVLAGAIGSLKPITLAVSLISLAIILGVRALRPTWPAMLIAVGFAAAATAFLHLDVATIGTRFGGLPSGLPAPALPPFSLAKLRAEIPDAFAIALLGAIESLLSAVVADGMSGRRHRSNCELVAQGVANVVAPIFGGLPVTGTVARTAANVRSGSHGPISGVLHALFVLAFMLAAGPLASYIPLAALGAVLAVVSWNMAEKGEFAALIRSRDGDTLVLLATFLLTIFVDLTTGIGVGVTLSAFLFLRRMAESVEVGDRRAFLGDDRSDQDNGEHLEGDDDLMVYHIRGAFFFGATATVNAMLDRVKTFPRAFAFDLTDMPIIDRTAANALHVFAKKLAKAKTRVLIVGANAPARRALLLAGLRRPQVVYVRSLDAYEALGPAADAV